MVTTKACVSPLVNKAEPWASGNKLTSHWIGRTVLVSRPSIRRPVESTFSRIVWCITFSIASPTNAVSTSFSSGTLALTSSANCPKTVARSCLSVMLKASLYLSPKSFKIRLLKLVYSSGKLGTSHFSLPASAANSLINLITSWKLSNPNITEPSITSSESSLASDSTIKTPSSVPATVNSNSEVACCSILGFNI